MIPDDLMAATTSLGSRLGKIFFDLLDSLESFLDSWFKKRKIEEIRGKRCQPRSIELWYSRICRNRWTGEYQEFGNSLENAAETHPHGLPVHQVTAALAFLHQPVIGRRTTQFLQAHFQGKPGLWATCSSPFRPRALRRCCECHVLELIEVKEFRSQLRGLPLGQSISWNGCELPETELQMVCHGRRRVGKCFGLPDSYLNLMGE